MRDLVRLASRVWGTKRWQRPSSAGLWPEAPAGRGDYCDIIWHGVSPTISHRLENVRHRVGKIATQAKHVNLVDINEEICLTTLVNRC